MSASTSRQVVIDDNDSSIVYSSNWIALTNGTKNNVGNFGATLKSTLHGTNGNGTFRYEFSGKRIDVFGTTDVKNFSGTSDPSWECFIDNDSIGATVPFTFPENNWLLCSADNMTDTHHVLTVNVLSRGHFFWLDYLRYTPSDSDDLGTAIVYVPHTDPAIEYDTSWQALGAVASYTSVKGSTAKFQFTGMSLTWYAMTPSELPTQPSKGTYSIDGGPSQPFILPGLSPEEVTQYNQVVFETSALTNGPHSITVTFDSDKASTPLTLSHILIQNGTRTPSSSGTANGSSSTSNSRDGLAAIQNSQNAPKIAAAVLGCTLFFCLAAYAIMSYRKYRKGGRTRDSKTWKNIIKPFTFSRTPPRVVESESMSTLGLFGPPEESNRRRREWATHSLPSPLRRVDIEAEHEQPSPPPVPPLPPTLPAKLRSPPEQVDQPEASGSSKPRRKSKGKAKEQRAAAIEKLDENASYYGGYQTWGQTKALEAASGAKARDSYC